jgi:ATP-dependent helicase/nuclease subunit A
MRELLDVAADDTPETLRAAFVDGLPEANLRRAAAALDSGSESDQRRAGCVRAFLEAGDRADRVSSEWLEIFMTAEGKPRNTLITKKAQKEDPGALSILQEEQRRVGEFCERLKAVTVANGTAALLRLGSALLDHYENGKRSRALLDYDDLILHSGALLSREGYASWVLYKLDGGIDHVLIDEAQDTSPEQWDVVAALCEEFFAGRGARPRPRTVFAVGDRKQSIFSFQGAEPAAFESMQARFAARIRAASQVFDPVDLKVSFRSCAAVLDLVDAVFNHPTGRDGVIPDGGEVRHLAYRKNAGGLVEMWPPVVPAEDEPGDPWDAPLDYAGASSPSVILAQRIAAAIRRWIDDREILESCGRPIRPGDILILVRKRDAFFEAMVRALKAADIPVAGADRMVLGEQIAVMDLMALARFALLPEDDLNLATVLKGPLFDFDDDDLFALCHGRTRRLWATLRARAAERRHWSKAVDELGALLAQADYTPPFEFFATVLGKDRGRARLLARLGHEAADPIDEFLALSLNYERQNAASLQGFLEWFEAGAAEVKRDMEQNRDEVRVMTVHGAKGLEANIVFLPDTCGVPDGRNDSKLLWSDGPVPLALWPIRSANDDPCCAAARETAREARAREYRRLLYVAATRARDRLYVCGWHAMKRSPQSWYDLLGPAFESHADAVPVALPWQEPGRRIAVRQSGPCDPERPIRVDTAATGAAPAWTAQTAPAEPTPPRPLMPSRPEAEPSVRSPLGADDGARFKRGRLVHRLLQTLPDLPPEAREPAAARYLARPVHALTADQQQQIAREVLAIFDQPEFGPLFGAGCVAEVPVVGRIGDRVISAQLDRLVVTDDEVLVLDYKTQRPVPPKPNDVAPVYLAQMAAYRQALGAVYPDRPIRCCLLWTDGPVLMELPAELLDRHKAS